MSFALGRKKTRRVCSYQYERPPLKCMQSRVSWNPYTGTRTRTRVYVNVSVSLGMLPFNSVAVFQQVALLQRRDDVTAVEVKEGHGATRLGTYHLTGPVAERRQHGRPYSRHDNAYLRHRCVTYHIHRHTQTNDITAEYTRRRKNNRYHEQNTQATMQKSSTVVLTSSATPPGL